MHLLISKYKSTFVIKTWHTPSGEMSPGRLGASEERPHNENSLRVIYYEQICQSKIYISMQNSFIYSY